MLPLLPLLSALSLSSLGGCVYEPTLITLTGRVVDAPSEDADGISSATVESLDYSFAPVDSDETDGRGSFQVQVYANNNMYFEVSAQGYGTTGFAGFAPGLDTAIDDGLVWMQSEETLAELDNSFGDCAQQGGALIEGVIRLGVQGYSPEEGDWPLSTTGFATAYDSAGSSYPACYLSDVGAYDPEAVETGNSGRFAIYGAPTGPVTLQAGYRVEDSEVVQDFYLYVPEDGVVSLYSVVLYL